MIRNDPPKQTAPKRDDLHGELLGQIERADQKVAGRQNARHDRKEQRDLHGIAAGRFHPGSKVNGLVIAGAKQECQEQQTANIR